MLRSEHIDPSLLAVTEKSVRDHQFFIEEDIEINKQVYREIQQQVDLARVVHGDTNVLDKCLNPLILNSYSDLFSKN